MIYVCLRSIWMDLDERIPNTIPASQGITSAQFLGYFLFNILCCIFIWFRPGQLRPYFHVGSLLVAVTIFILLGWAVGTSHGYGSVFNSKTTISSTELGWQMSGGVMSVIGSIASGILNQNDFTRFAKQPSHVTYTQAFSFMFTSSVMAIVGVVVTAATQNREYTSARPCRQHTTNCSRRIRRWQASLGSIHVVCGHSGSARLSRPSCHFLPRYCLHRIAAVDQCRWECSRWWS